MKLKEKLLIYLMRKESSYFWSFVDMLAYKLDKIAEIYDKRSVGNEYRKEYRAVGISENDKILHVGCGAYPITAITLAKINGVHIVGIDKNPKAVELAKDVIHRKKLDKKIKIENGDGINYPVGKFNTIIISSCSTPKEKILEHILRNAKPKSKIIARDLDPAAQIVTDSIALHSDIVLVEKIRHYPSQFYELSGWQSFYLIKKQ